MKHYNLLSLIAFIGLSGCDTINYAQYKISNVTVDSSDARKVKTSLKEVAQETGLEDRLSTSRLPGTLAYYCEPNVQNFRTDLGARFYGDDILVDVVAGFGPMTAKYIQVRNLTGRVLAKEFGTRVSIPAPLIRIPPVPE